MLPSISAITCGHERTSLNLERDNVDQAGPRLLGLLLLLLLLLMAGILEHA